MIKKYQYNGETYTSKYMLRKAIWEHDRTAISIPNPETAEGWAALVKSKYNEEEDKLIETPLGIVYTEEPDPEPSLEDLKNSKLSSLESAFLRWYNDGAVVISSLGFTADSDERAITDVTGLVTVEEAKSAEERSTVAFMDSSNQPHMLTLDQLKILQLEIIQNGQYAYQQKWSLRTAIEQAEDKEALDAIQIKFEAYDFSKEQAE